MAMYRKQLFDCIWSRDEDNEIVGRFFDVAIQIWSMLLGQSAALVENDIFSHVAIGKDSGLVYKSMGKVLFFTKIMEYYGERYSLGWKASGMPKALEWVDDINAEAVAHRNRLLKIILNYFGGVAFKWTG